MGVSILCAKLLKEMLVPMSLLLFFVCFEASAIEIVVGKKPGSINFKDCKETT